MPVPPEFVLNPAGVDNGPALSCMMKKQADEDLKSPKVLRNERGEHDYQIRSPQFQMPPIQTVRPPHLGQFLPGSYDPSLMPNAFPNNPSPMLYPHDGFHQSIHIPQFRGRELPPYSQPPQESAPFPMWPNQYRTSHQPQPQSQQLPQPQPRFGRIDRMPRSLTVQHGMRHSYGAQEQKGSATKTSVYKAMHDCYLTNCRNTGRQDAFHSTGYNIPTYEELERALPTDAMVNAARIAMLRSRHLMVATLEPIKDSLPCAPEKYVINSITTSCPICGRAIALNKLASHENWCKHLECCHRDVGKAISNRFRALAKNEEQVPSVQTDFSSWAEILPRVDMAPDMNRSVPYFSDKLVPLSAEYHWIAILFHQLLLEDALLAHSIITQEIVVFILKHFNLQVKGRLQFEDLFRFQSDLTRYPNSFKGYCEEHVSIIETGDNGRQNPETPAILEEGRAAYGGVMSPRPHFAEIEQTLMEACSDGVKRVNAHRILVLRRRQLLRRTFELVGYRLDPTYIASFVVNAAVTCCPFCNVELSPSLDDLGDMALCVHMRSTHGKPGSLVAAVHSSLDNNETVSPVPMDILPPLATPRGAIRQDFALDYDERSAPSNTAASKLVPLKPSCIDWRSILLDHLLRTGVLSTTSVLTQELVIMGLFYFGLVNQRSPQKLGQYLQLQAFQVGLHERSGPGYDIYIGAGIKEGELSAAYTRGRPVQATKAVLQSYHHYGLSRKSIQRNDRKRKRSISREKELADSCKSK